MRFWIIQAKSWLVDWVIVTIKLSSKAAKYQYTVVKLSLCAVLLVNAVSVDNVGIYLSVVDAGIKLVKVN